VGKFWVGFATGVVLIPLIVLCYLVLGIAPAATTAPPMPLERFIAGAALNSRINRESPKREPTNFTVADLVDGVAVYEKNCAVCHGLYQRPAPPIGKAMYPEGICLARRGA